MSDLNLISADSEVDLLYHLNWRSNTAIHTDCYHARRINIWRDLIPDAQLSMLLGKTVGDRVNFDFQSNRIVPAYDQSMLFDVRLAQFFGTNGSGETSQPRLGRFYPKGRLKGLPNIFSTNIQPFRCVGMINGHMSVDFNHPLAEYDINLSALVADIGSKTYERGGTSVDWMEALTFGPGMQGRWRKRHTDFFSDDLLVREDDRPDSEFYQQARFVHHLDATAREMVKNTYARFLKDGMRVLDLMSSWESHLSERIYFDQLIGIGLNEEEMRRNPHLSDHRVHDLNNDPSLPFGSNMFDAVINTASIEYLTDPVAIFKEVERILRPNGYFIVTFSNRWFPTKAINIWSELHEFERVGLILEYFSHSGGFDDLHSYSIRGLPRPYDDKYFPEKLLSDPIYAVWGRKKDL